MAEIKRAVAKGHKGVIYPASPMELRDVPHINEPAYDPLWAACQELGVPLCFHSGASPKIQMRPGDAFLAGGGGAHSAAWFVRSAPSRCWRIFCFRACSYRFPKLKVVFAESSLGWGAYEIEYADYQSDADGLPSEGYPLKPSELFQRQCYFTCWYDRMSLRRASTISAAPTFFGRAIFRWRLRLGPIRASSVELSFCRCSGRGEAANPMGKRRETVFALNQLQSKRRQK